MSRVLINYHTKMKTRMYILEKNNRNKIEKYCERKIKKEINFGLNDMIVIILLETFRGFGVYNV